ncbi:exodeoxyribonuclease VII large subunit [Cytobacillus sp. IB215316]|uniref:exodeoxyribonuclease VII large subunit n=1 Tax=Cytobacillus sp. IB215316 TaxID=3097354 RepID=UPI002A117434|nr:exodeoxyribonuclease VII large subunit [Cytobacillus sp. IB215316]MDX8359646.1 exodeoxyribonuclease VII large subunit [Cytobacillus sp. IB215316]
MGEKKFVTVTALTKYVKRKFDVDPHLQDIWVKGEISNFTLHSRGHMYFTLKDEGAKIQAVMFAKQNRTLKYKPENGMKVLLRGEISVYQSSGSYQIYVKEMEPDGIGSLYTAFEELKKRLDEEGLFLSKHKKNIPKFPRYIGVITSPTGAAVRDILTTIKRRYPIANVIILPALVQGEYAPQSLVEKIKYANQLAYLDVLILGRGGGSIEELWAFNEESVAREIFASSIPVISAVGHETDFTISDFVADLRAPTPTGAAEMAVPKLSDVAERLSQNKVRLIKLMKQRLVNEADQLNHMKKSYAFRYPQQLYAQKNQELDRMLEQLKRTASRLVSVKQDSAEHLMKRLIQKHPKELIHKALEQHSLTTKALQKEIQNVVKQKQLLFTSNVSKLDALSPLKVMDRGFSLVYDKNDLIVKSVERVKVNDSLTIQMKDGKVACEVCSVEERMIDE